MNLDRALIKTQARQLIKGKVWTLFLITFVVYLLTAGVYAGSSAASAADELKNDNVFSSFSKKSGNYSGGDLEHYFDGLDDYYGSSGNSNGNSNGNSGENQSSQKPGPEVVKNLVSEHVTRALWIINIVCAPLEIALCGVYLMLIKGNPQNVKGEFSYTFKNTFSKGYFNRFFLMFFQTLFTLLWSILFLIPGIVYAYKVYFARYIQIEYPSLSWKECLDVSKKMTQGHKGELFALDLSFIPWLLLTAVTCGLVQIYAAPYYSTVKALYYENFKQRALQTGEVTPADFMSEEERYANYLNNPQNRQQAYYNPSYNNTYYNVNSVQSSMPYAQNAPAPQNQQNNYNENEYRVQPLHPETQANSYEPEQNIPRPDTRDQILQDTQAEQFAAQPEPQDESKAVQFKTENEQNANLNENSAEQQSENKSNDTFGADDSGI